MRLRSFLLLFLTLTVSGCFPRLARYEGEPAPQPRPTPAVASGEPLPFDFGREPVSVDRVYAFIALTNPFITPSLARSEAELIVKHASNEGVPVSLLSSLIATESSFNPRAVSPVGAQGLGQLMPATARDLGVNDPFDVEQNIHGTAKYLAWLGAQWKDHPRRWEMVLASYLAGIGTVSNQLKAGRDLTNEQNRYVKKILHLSGKV